MMPNTGLCHPEDSSWGSLREIADDKTRSSAPAREQLQVLPKSPEGQAIAYTLSNWSALTRYCGDGDLEIDNNGAERSLRGVAIGRRNWTFLGSDNGGRTAAVLTSLIATCKRLGVEPFTYLRDIFERLCAHPQNRLAELLPDQWMSARSPTANT